MTRKFTLKQVFLGKGAAAIMHTVRATVSWKSEGFYDEDGKHWSCGKPVILAFWHSQQLLMPWIYREGLRDTGQKPLHALVSQHGDGRLAASFLEQLCVQTIAGSSSRGGMLALLRLSRCLKDGDHVGITPDGPKGPKEESKPGIVKLASMTGAPIVPVALQIDKKWSFNSWDTLVLPKPFSTVSVLMGKSIPVGKDLERSALNDQSDFLTKTLLTLNLQAANRLPKSLIKQ